MVPESSSSPEKIGRMSRESLRRAHKRASISSVASFSRTQRALSVEEDVLQEDEAETEVQTPKITPF